MAKDAAEFIELTGARKIAEATGNDLGVVRVWKYRNYFPRAVWLTLNQAFPELTPEALQAFEAHKRQAA